MARSRINNLWNRMKGRCHTPSCPDYYKYGARGIKVCSRWRDSFQAFFDDVSILPHFGEDGYSLERIDNNGDYEPGNVEWADDKTQANNRRSNVLYTYNGKTQTLALWADELGINYKKLWARINQLHWDIDKAFNTP